MKEVEVAPPVISWLEEQNWDVYQEVNTGLGSNTADIVALRNGLVWVIECKTRMGIEVLAQATRWGAHFRSVCVPQIRKRSRNFNLWLDLAQRVYLVGVIVVYGDNRVYQELPPPLQRRNHKYAQEYIAKALQTFETDWCICLRLERPIRYIHRATVGGTND